jgi:hypothetical protein
MKAHAAGYTVAQALELARSLEHGPLPEPTDPTPTPAEAIELIRHGRRTCGFTWLTGETAESVLRAYMEGTKSADKAPAPYPEWTDEHRAWREGQVSRRERTGR